MDIDRVLIRPVPVVVCNVLTQRGEQVPFAVDEDVVQALPACGADPRSANAFARGWTAHIFGLATLLRIFSDESIEDRSSPHPCHSKICDWRRGRVGGGQELMPCLVRPVPVVVGDVLAKRVRVHVVRHG